MTTIHDVQVGDVFKFKDSYRKMYRSSETTWLYEDGPSFPDTWNAALKLFSDKHVTILGQLHRSCVVMREVGFSIPDNFGKDKQVSKSKTVIKDTRDFLRLISEKDDQIEQLQIDYEELQQELRHEQDENNDQKHEIAELENTVAEHESSIETYESEIDEKDGEISNLEDEVSDQENTISNLEEEVKELTAEVDNLIYKSAGEDQ